MTCISKVKEIKDFCHKLCTNLYSVSEAIRGNQKFTAALGSLLQHLKANRTIFLEDVPRTPRQRSERKAINISLHNDSMISFCLANTVNTDGLKLTSLECPGSLCPCKVTVGCKSNHLKRLENENVHQPTAK